MRDFVASNNTSLAKALYYFTSSDANDARSWLFFSISGARLKMNHCIMGMHRGLKQVLHTTTPWTLIAAAILKFDRSLSFMIKVKVLVTLEGARRDAAILASLFLLVAATMRATDFTREG
jgi:isoleucyl-tRNA synthetase